MPLILALLLLLACAAPAAAAPNVVIVETDDQTAEQMWVMDRTRALIGAEGTTFEDSFVSLSLCCPSRASLLTGQYAHNHGVLDIVPPWGGFDRFAGTETLATWLQRRGYATVLLGKYLNRYGRRDPHEVPPGWSEWHGLVDPTTYNYLDYTFNDYGVLHRGREYQTDAITQRAQEIVARRAASPQPFFLWVTYIAPHNGLPREPGDPPGMPTPVPAARHKGAFAWERGAHYRQELESLLAVDEGVGGIVGALARSGELDDTLLIFTSDNGFMHGEHGIRTGKRVPYEPSIRVPLLMRGPGVPRGLRLPQLAANIDIAPTVLEAAGAAAAWPPDGISLWPYLRDPGLETGREILLEGTARKRTGVPRFTGLRTRTHTYVEHDTGRRELYDLRRDPGELRNLAGRSTWLERALATRLARLRSCAGAGCRPAPSLRLLARPVGGVGRLGGCHFSARLGGRALSRVRGAWLAADARRVRLRAPAFSSVVSGGTTVRARVRLADDRVVTVDRALPLCR